MGRASEGPGDGRDLNAFYCALSGRGRDMLDEFVRYLDFRERVLAAEGGLTAMAKVTGNGTIVQLEKDKPRGKCRKWQLRVPIGKDPRTGKYKTHTRRIEGTYTQATKALREFIDEIEGGHVQGKTSYTIEEYCKRYADRRERNKELEPTTLQKLRNECKALCHLIGKANIASVTTTMANDMYSALLGGDSPSGKPFTGTYVNSVHVTASMVFGEAVNEGLIASNPFEKASPPRKDTKERHAVKAEQVKAFVESLDASKDHDCAYFLAVATGLRCGEVCGLSWGDVDFDDRSIYVHRSFTRYGELKAPKTESGIRLLPMSSTVIDALRRHKDAQAVRFARINHERARTGRETEPLAQTDDTPVITCRTGARMAPNALSVAWRKARGDLGLADFTLHELRHTHLTMLALKKVHPRTMQELAGHSKPNITMSIYTHTNLEAKREAADEIESFF